MKGFIALSPDHPGISFWLLAIAGGLIALQLHLAQRLTYGGYNLEACLFWLAALSIAWRRRHTLNLDSDVASTSIGLILIGWILLRSLLIDYDGGDILIRVSPLISAVALCLLASGVSRIQQYWRELSIVCLSAFPVEHLLARLGAFIDVYPPLLDAKVSAYLLWYLGFDATQQGVYVSLPTGAIEIYGPCSSFGMMFYLWQFSAVFLLTFPLSRNRGIVLVVLSTLMALIVNGVRLSLLAVIVSHQDQAGFAYWHGSSGAQIFSTVAVLLFGCLCSVLMKDTQSREDNLGETS